MPEYLFEYIPATPYAKSLSMQAGRSLSAFAHGAHPYLTGTDIKAAPAPAAVPEPRPASTWELEFYAPAELASEPRALPPEILSSGIGHGTESVYKSGLLLPTPTPAIPTNLTFDPVIPAFTQASPEGVKKISERNRLAVRQAPAPPKVFYDYDVAVIGGGPAGYTAAIRAAELGAKVVLFEMDEVGGTDLYRGRIPMKAFFKLSEQIRQMRNAAEQGISVPKDGLKMKDCVAYKDELIEQIAANLKNELETSKVTVRSTRAALKSEHEVFSGEGLFTADKVILCGGRQPLLPSLPGIQHVGVATGDVIFRMKTPPKRLLILGGGSIGCAAASIFAAFGSKVALAEKQARILPDADENTSQKVLQTLLASGVRVCTGTPIFGVTDAGGRPCAETEQGGIECDLLYTATSRKPNLLGLGMLAGQIARENGTVKVNAAMQTNLPNIYAAGDITDRVRGISAIMEDAEIAAEHAVIGEKTVGTPII